MKIFFRKFLYPSWCRKIYGYLSDKILCFQCIDIIKNSEFKNILIMDTIPWVASFKQRPQHIAEQLAQHFDVVLYKSSMIMNFKWHNDKILLCPKLCFVKCPKKNIVYYIDSINEYRDVKFLKKIKSYGYKIIYDYIDEFSNKICNTKKPRKVYKNLEKIKPDLVIVSADKLYNDIKTRFTKEKIVIAKNGVCPDDFAKISDLIPNDIKPIVEQKKPIVGYYGVISRWLDYDLLAKAAESCPDYNFVFIGKDSQLSSQKLKMYNNVYVLGRKEYEELPNYAQFFNCCIIPFQKGKIAKATSPVKLFEYMALKKPIVCTRDLNECRGYDGVLMSENDDEFIKNLSTAIRLSKENSLKDKLWQYANENSWQKRAESIYEKMRNI